MKHFVARHQDHFGVQNPGMDEPCPYPLSSIFTTSKKLGSNVSISRELHRTRRTPWVESKEKRE
jgi:hypothetical protein